jgi:hypothetical protein
MVFTWAERDGQIKSLDIDAVLREGSTEVSEITENPIELSADVADHIRDKTDSLTLEFVITNTPTRTPETNADGSQGAFRKGSHNGVALQFSSEFDRVASVRDTLTRVRTEGLKWQIFSALRVYTDFMIEQIQIARDNKTGDSAKFTMQMRRVRFVQTRVVAVPARRRRVPPTQALGTQPATAPRSTTLLQIANRIRGTS